MKRIEKEISAIYYFIDIGMLSLIAICGFALEINKWMGIFSIALLTLWFVSTSIHLTNKDKKQKEVK